MQTQAQLKQFSWLMPLVVFIVAGLLIGVGVGYLVWSPGATDFGVVSSSKEDTRTVKVNWVSVTFPSVVIAKAGADSTLNIGVTNLRNDPIYVVTSLALVRNNGIDATTVSALTSNPYSVTLAAYGSANDPISFKPSSTGYAFFDLMINNDLAGTITVYAVPA